MAICVLMWGLALAAGSEESVLRMEYLVFVMWVVGVNKAQSASL